MADYSPVRILICGRLAIETPNSVVLESQFPARQGRRLWAYLVLTRRFPVSRDDLAVAVWGDGIPDAWDVALNTLISRLRTLLKPVALAAPGLAISGEIGRYRLELPPGAFVDSERARMALHNAESKLNLDDVEVALPEARVAMEIAGRGFLSGESGEWIESHRRALRNMQVRALECTVNSELRRGNSRLAMVEAQQLIELEPTHEPGYQLAMRAAAANSNVLAVTRIVTECRAMLHQHAGAALSPETERLYQLLIEGRQS